MTLLTPAQRNKCIQLLEAIDEVGPRATNEALAIKLNISKKTVQRLLLTCLDHGLLSMQKTNTKNRTLTISEKGISMITTKNKGQNQGQNRGQKTPLYIKKTNEDKKHFEVTIGEIDRRQWLASLLFKTSDELQHDANICKILGVAQGYSMSFPETFGEPQKVSAYLFAAYQYSLYKGFSLISLVFAMQEYTNDPEGFCADVKALIANNWKNLDNARQARKNYASKNRRNAVEEGIALQQQATSKQVGFRLEARAKQHQPAVTTVKETVQGKPVFSPTIIEIEDDQIGLFMKAVSLNLVSASQEDLFLFLGALVRATKTVKKNGGSVAKLFGHTVSNQNFEYVTKEDLRDAQRLAESLLKRTEATLPFEIQLPQPQKPSPVKNPKRCKEFDLSTLSEEAQVELRKRAEESLGSLRHVCSAIRFEGAVQLRMEELAHTEKKCHL